jgi:cytochrome bd-type quinol oxidase subunit 2
MNDSGRQRWRSEAILVGVLYFAVGIASIALAGAASSNEMRDFWRVTAFAFSAVVFAGHVAEEHFRLRSTARPAAWHASVAVALGAFLLALTANIHDLGSASGYRPKMLIALVAWPILTAVPAFVVALVVAAALGVRRRGV